MVVAMGARGMRVVVDGGRGDVMVMMVVFHVGEVVERGMRRGMLQSRQPHTKDREYRGAVSKDMSVTLELWLHMSSAQRRGRVGDGLTKYSRGSSWVQTPSGCRKEVGSDSQKRESGERRVMSGLRLRLIVYSTLPLPASVRSRGVDTLGCRFADSSRPQVASRDRDDGRGPRLEFGLISYC